MKKLSGLVDNFIYFAPRIIVYTIFVLFLLLSILIYFSYFEPYLYPLHFSKGKVEIVSNNVLIGPYPEKKELQRLKDKFHVTTVISLLNSSLPQEKSLIDRESKVTEILGLKFYNFPLEYIDIHGLHNRKVLSDLIEFIKNNPNEKFYIHDYLGRHRVKLIKDNIKK